MWLVFASRLLGEPVSIFQGWNYRQIAASTWHVLGPGDPKSGPHIYSSAFLKPSPQLARYF